MWNGVPGNGAILLHYAFLYLERICKHGLRACQKVFLMQVAGIHILRQLINISLSLVFCAAWLHEMALYSGQILFYHYYLHMKYNKVLISMYENRIKTIISLKNEKL
jgi:hypothetical protein